MGDADYVRALEEIAHAAWHALDDSEDTGDEITIRRLDYDLLSDAMAELDGGDGDIHDVLRRRRDSKVTENDDGN